jgi:hypothetical protein
MCSVTLLMPLQCSGVVSLAVIGAVLSPTAPPAVAEIETFTDQANESRKSLATMAGNM